MASAHVPMLLDGRPVRGCRGVACVDGSFPDFFTGENCDFLQVRRQAALHLCSWQPWLQMHLQRAAAWPCSSLAAASAMAA